MTDCGFAAYCGRPAKHRGHHGGWRTHVHAVAPIPVVRDSQIGGVGQEIPAQSLRVLAETLTHGSEKEAAACLGLSYQTVKNHVMTVLSRTGAASYGNAAVVLGWVTFPRGVTHPIEAAS